MTPDPITHLCAILRGDSNRLPVAAERDRLLAEARAHRVDRLVAWRTGQISEQVRAAAILDEVDVRELNRVLAGLEAHGIAPLVFKGAALAHTHYQASWLRPRVDNDLLIAGSQRRLVIDVLYSLGYTRPPFIAGELVMYQMPFARVSAMGEVHLDVHWRVANPQILAGMPAYEDLASRASIISVRGQPMRTPCPVDALLLACVHRAAHHGLSRDLLWLYDIHLLAERFSPREWSEFVTLASKHRVRALCGSGVLAARDCFLTSLPAEDLSHLTNCAEREPSALYLKKDLTRLRRLLADLRALTLRARLRLLAEHLIPPARYISQKYQVKAGPLLPLLYLRRLAEGLPRMSKRV
jgi:hypothetical protein